MQNKTKILLGLGLAATGVVAYFVLKPKKAVTTSTLSNTLSNTNSVIVPDVVKTPSKTIITPKTPTEITEIVTGTTKSPYLRKGVDYMIVNGAISYADESSGRLSKYDPTHGNIWGGGVSADPLFWEGQDMNTFYDYGNTFAGQGWGGMFSEESQV